MSESSVKIDKIDKTEKTDKPEQIEKKANMEIQIIKETKINKTPSYTLRAQKNYYNKIKDIPEFKTTNNEKAIAWINNNREKHNKNQKLYREKKKAKLLEEKNKNIINIK